MIAAIQLAKNSIDKFRELSGQEMRELQVKVKFVSNSGETEHLWAEVMKLGESSVDVRYLTPPVTHSGKLERLHTHPISDIEDWVAINNDGNIYGGYTQRVMFERARETWGELPPELKQQESRYVD